MANNPYVNKVVFGSATLVDLTGTTATADKIMQGYGAFGADGAWMDGTATGSSGDGYVWQDQDGYVHLSDEEGTGIIVDSLTVSGAGTYTAPTKHAYSPVTVPSGSASTPATSVTANPSISVSNSGLITATASATKSVTPTVSAGWVSNGTAGTVTVSGSNTSQLSTQAATTITPTTSAQTAVAAGKYTTGAVTVAAMPSGTAGTPTATKGTVSNHSISVTPSVTNTTGYITGGTKTGTAVSVSASELVSGTVTISASGNTDVTNYATASVAAGSATASATKGAVSNHSVTVTPSVTRTAGYITAGTATGTAVTVSASELVSGSETKTENGTYDVTNLASLIVNVSGGGGDSWSWMGKNPTKVKTYPASKKYLVNTEYANWTPSTSARALESASNYESYTPDTDYDYIIFSRFHSHFEYASQPNASVNDTYFSGAYLLGWYFNNKSSITADVPDSFQGVNLNLNIITVYKGTTGTEGNVGVLSYGVYQSGVSIPSYSNSAITAKSPNISARCNANYFSTTAAAAVNQNTSYYEYTTELWRVDRGTSPVGFFAYDTREMWLNGF